MTYVPPLFVRIDVPGAGTIGMPHRHQTHSCSSPHSTNSNKHRDDKIPNWVRIWQKIFIGYCASQSILKLGK